MRVCEFQDFSEYRNKSCISAEFLFIDQGVLGSEMTFFGTRSFWNTGEKIVKRGAFLCEFLGFRIFRNTGTPNSDKCVSVLNRWIREWYFCVKKRSIILARPRHRRGIRFR